MLFCTKYRMQIFMRENFRHIYSDKFVRVCVLLSCLFLLLLIIIIILSAGKLPPYIPLFNSMPWGEDRLFSSKSIFFLPAIFFGIFICNVVLATTLYKRYALISRILYFNLFLLMMLGLLAYVQIILLVF